MFSESRCSLHDLGNTYSEVRLSFSEVGDTCSESIRSLRDIDDTSSEPGLLVPFLLDSLADPSLLFNLIGQRSDPSYCLPPSGSHLLAHFLVIPIDALTGAFLLVTPICSLLPGRCLDLLLEVSLTVFPLSPYH